MCIRDSRTGSKQPSAWWWHIVTKFGWGGFDCLAILILLASKSRRPRVVYYGVVLSAKFFMANSFKMWYRAPRPYWNDKHLNAGEVECAHTYGNPSGFALVTTAFFLSVELDIIRNYLALLKPPVCMRGCTCCWVFTKVLLIFALVAFCYAVSFFLAISRFEVKTNGWNQIVYGMLLGLRCLSLIHI